MKYCYAELMGILTLEKLTFSLHDFIEGFKKNMATSGGDSWSQWTGIFVHCLIIDLSYNNISVGGYGRGLCFIVFVSLLSLPLKKLKGAIITKYSMIRS